MTPTRAVELLAVSGIPMVKPGDDLAGLVAAGLKGLQPRAGDVLCWRKDRLKAEAARRS
jgi:coenzyme F420-0:L-glutamate ligase/coenzyme F420-1:gamma-L-glutamate ligase